MSKRRWSFEDFRYSGIGEGRLDYPRHPIGSARIMRSAWDLLPWADVYQTPNGIWYGLLRNNVRNLLRERFRERGQSLLPEEDAFLRAIVGVIFYVYQEGGGEFFMYDDRGVLDEDWRAIEGKIRFKMRPVAAR